jgi:cyanamide hydratase
LLLNAPSDVIGANPSVTSEPTLLQRGTVDQIVSAFPRLRWDLYFTRAMKEEMRLKPWSMTTALEEDGFTNKIARNPLMAVYDGRDPDR